MKTWTVTMFGSFIKENMVMMREMNSNSIVASKQAGQKHCCSNSNHPQSSPKQMAPKRPWTLQHSVGVGLLEL